MKFNESSDSADARVQVRAYKVPFYVVNDIIYEQKWEFSVSDGWQYVSQKEGKP